MLPHGWLSNAPTAAWADEALVQECIRGNEQAWAALVDKYRNLIYSIPIKFRMSREDASEIFQQVCLTLIRELPRLRDVKSLAAWLIRVTSNSCYEWNRREGRYRRDEAEADFDAIAASGATDQLVREAEREQILREAIAQSRPRCRQLIHMLFFEDSPLPYQQVAERLGIATGSVGFIRLRCLRQLRVLLQKSGF